MVLALPFHMKYYRREVVPLNNPTFSTNTRLIDIPSHRRLNSNFIIFLLWHECECHRWLRDAINFRMCCVYWLTHIFNNVDRMSASVRRRERGKTAKKKFAFYTKCAKCHTFPHIYTIYRTMTKTTKRIPSHCCRTRDCHLVQ